MMYGFTMWAGGMWMFILLIVGVGLLLWSTGFFNNFRSPGVLQNRVEQPSAHEVAQLRYSRGEISREEYLNILEDLSL